MKVTVNGQEIEPLSDDTELETSRVPHFNCKKTEEGFMNTFRKGSRIIQFTTKNDISHLVGTENVITLNGLDMFKATMVELGKLKNESISGL